MVAVAGLAQAKELTDAQIENVVRGSYQYVAMYNVNNKFALKQGGWNTCVADTKLKDHTMREIARPNNDTLYIICLLDLRKDPVVLDMPAFDSKYVSLMITGYDHYVNIPMSTRQGDFKKPEKMLIYSARTEGYKGEPVKGVDRLFEATGDFVSAVFRVMPHGNDSERFKRIVRQMQSVKLFTLSKFRGGKAKPMNAMNDYVIRMAKKDLPPAKAFWSVTLYDVKNGFFIPNDRRKYSVGENAGMTLDKDGGIAIHIAAQKPESVPEDNWLPINRKDEEIGAIMRIYVPDLEKMKTWSPPKAERIAAKH